MKAGSVFRRCAVAGVALAASMAIAACSTGSADGPGDDRAAAGLAVTPADSEPGAKEPVPDPAPEVSVEDGARNVDPFTPVTVTSLGEGLETVTMSNEVGYVVQETLSADGKVWSSDETLGYNRTYTIEALDMNGKTTTVTFTTPEATGTASAALGPLDGSTVGVGQTVAVRFSQPIQDRKAAQGAIEVKASPEVEGAFYWLNDYEVRWRPQHLWEPGTEVEVNANIRGVDLGGGIRGDGNYSTSFTIGERVISIVDDETKTMKVYRNKKLLREIPVSLGTDNTRWATPNGRYIVGDMHQQLTMDSETFGYSHEEGGYRTDVNYATQLSYSGIYVHGAPWSVWAQGNTNQSHGCINMTDEDAAWFQSISQRGDIVRVKNTTAGYLPVSDGLGDWNLSWEKWSEGNAD